MSDIELLLSGYLFGMSSGVVVGLACAHGALDFVRWREEQKYMGRPDSAWSWIRSSLLGHVARDGQEGR